jgi:outer membrane protein assembly factor BamB
MCVRTGGKDDATKSQILWQETKAVPEVPSPLVWRHRLYLIRNGGLLACRDLETGKLIYDERLDAPGGYFASPVLVEGRIFLASDRGTVTVVKAGDSFAPLARNDLGEPIIASPAVSDDTLYIRSAGHLWAFAEKNKQSGPASHELNPKDR